MNESENLLVITLDQLGCLPKDVEIKSLTQIANEDYVRILIKVCKKIISAKGFEMPFPETISRDMSMKYKECQKIVDFIKYIGYKSDLNINNILFPSIRDMQRLLEYTLEYITNIDVGMGEYSQSYSEKNYSKMKIGKCLSTWQKDAWVAPEFLNNITPPKTKQCLRFDSSKISGFRKVISGNSASISQDLMNLSKIKTEEISNSSCITILQDDDYNIRKFNTLQNQNHIVSKLKSQCKPQLEKTINQQFVENINKRNNAIDFLIQNYQENNFINNVKILERKNKEIYGTVKLTHYNPHTSISNDFSSMPEPEDTSPAIISETTSMSSMPQPPQKNTIQKKIDNMILNYEKEKEAMNGEIVELNNKLMNIVNSIEKMKENEFEQNNKHLELSKNIEELSMQNEGMIREIEEKMMTFEQIKKLQKSEIREDDITQELSTFEKKYEDMVSKWEEYSNQAKSRVEELKTTIETKKKEYNYKYEKINSLKRDIEEISSKIALKQELANFLNEEYQRIPIDINRNKFITKISELTQSIIQEKLNITNYLNDSKNTDSQILNVNETIKRVDNELEDKLFQDAKSTPSLKELYSSFIKIREGYNVIQKNIIDTQTLKYKLKDLENKVDDFQIKLKSYDYNQLKEQVDYLVAENSKSFK